MQRGVTGTYKTPVAPGEACCRFVPAFLAPNSPQPIEASLQKSTREVHFSPARSRGTGVKRNRMCEYTAYLELLTREGQP
jgi:hypothetical protein